MTKDHQTPKRNVTEKVTLVSTDVQKETKDESNKNNAKEVAAEVNKTTMTNVTNANAMAKEKVEVKATEGKNQPTSDLNNKKESDKKADKLTQDAQVQAASQAKTQPAPTVIEKKGGTGVGLLALLVALGVGGAGYYFGQQEVNQIQQKLTALENRPAATAQVEIPNFDQEKAEISKLAESNAALNDKVAMLEREVSTKEQTLNALQNQINGLNAGTKTEQNDWLLSEADFLLTNALRKLVLDNDVDTSISLLKVADESLQKVSDPRVIPVRSAINQDLKKLLSVNNVDQNAIMQRLSQLANTLDELRVLNVSFEQESNNDKLTESVEDWEENAKKSVNSFLNHFIRVTPRHKESKAILAPSQEIYLRENIRLRLQIAILAVPRQQNELYKQSLEAVAAWVRSYFDTAAAETVDFLKEIDELAAQSIYIDVPDQLHSLKVLDEALNRQAPEVQKVELNVDRQLAEDNKAVAEEVQQAEAKEDKAAEEKASETKEAGTVPETATPDAPAQDVPATQVPNVQ